MGKKIDGAEALGVPSVEIIEPNEEVKRTLGYFAIDGNYGDASGLLVLETTYWREIDWQILDSASDDMRANVARLITESYEKPEDLAALYTKFEQYGIDLDDFMPREPLQLDNDEAAG